MGPTDITKAEDLGAELIKLFPANTLGASYVRDIKEIFPDLLFMPTGGVETSEENLNNWFRSGAHAVGLGSKLLGKNFMEAKDYKAIESLTKQTLEIVQKIKAR